MKKNRGWQICIGPNRFWVQHFGGLLPNLHFTWHQERAEQLQISTENSHRGSKLQSQCCGRGTRQQTDHFQTEDPIQMFPDSSPQTPTQLPTMYNQPWKGRTSVLKALAQFKKKKKRHISTSTELCDLDRTHLTIELSPTGNAYWASNLETF